MEKNVHWWALAALVVAAAATVATADGARRDSDAGLTSRTERGAANRETCRYAKAAWSACDPKTNVRSRTLTLKKGDVTSCERFKIIQKKCKKACRYEKSPWSECSASGEMSRTDRLKGNSDAGCEPSRRLTKKCNKNKQLKSTKEKGTLLHNTS